MWNWTENQIELYLIRHGMTLGNVEHRYIGRQTDEPLSEDGRQQLEKRKDQWAQVCRTGDMPYVFVSPMLRCRQTAEILFPQIPEKKKKKNRYFFIFYIKKFKILIFRIFLRHLAEIYKKRICRSTSASKPYKMCAPGRCAQTFQSTAPAIRK